MSRREHTKTYVTEGKRKPNKVLRSLYSFLFGLKSGNRHRRHNIFDIAAARKVVEGLCKALAYGAYRHVAAEALGDFISDVAGVDVGEDEYVCVTRHG